MSTSADNKRSSEYPPNPTQWKFERNAMELRQQFGLSSSDPLDPHRVVQAHSDRVFLVDRDLLERCSHDDYEAAVTRGGDEWSAVTFQLDQERWAIVMNPAHSQKRQRSTLMEEIFHMILRHQPEQIFTDPICGAARREFSEEKESEAYYSGAAALVPYAGLREMLESGKSTSEIAEHFGVAVDLVHMRAKLCKLWSRCKPTDRF